MTAPGEVVAVHRSREHAFSKHTQDEIEIIERFGVDGDAHGGVRVQHLSRVRADPTQPNLRQVHLIHCELFDEMADLGFAISPGQLGENITTRGIDLLNLGRDDCLIIGEAILRVTGLRNPCAQIEAFQPGLLQHLAFRRDGEIVRKAGIMSVVESGGIVRPGHIIRHEPSPGPFMKLDRV